MSIFSRIANLFQTSKVDSEIDAELRSHIEMRIEENIASGMTGADARRDALVRFGNPTSTRERVAAADTHLGLAGIGRDIRYALRQLRRTPGFAATAILTLGLGIGANVVVFGLMNAIILRPLPLANPDRLFEVAQREVGSDSQSYPDYLDLRARNSTLSDLAAFRLGGVALGAGGQAQRCWEYEVSGNYFDLLGAQPALGRLFHQSDERGPNSAPYIVLSNAFWHARFGGDPHVIGTTVELNKHPFTIIGVAQKSFNGTELFLWPDFWMPIVNEVQVEGYNFLTSRGSHGTNLIGALKPGVTQKQAVDNLNAIAKELAHEYPSDDDGLVLRLVKPGLMGDMLQGPARAFLSAMMALALLVLTAVCVNLAGIFAARSADRARELAIRLSIGSTRWRILRQVITEAVVVAAVGGMVGTMLAAVLLGLLSRWQPISQYPIHVAAVADLRVYVIALLLSLASGILPGLLPARQVWRTDATQAMKSNSTATGLMRRLTVRDVLLCVQIALCALLVTASFVSLRGMERSLHAPLGFVPEGAVLAETDMQMAGYSDDSALLAQRRIIEAAQRIPGVTAAATINQPPLRGGGSSISVFREGEPDLRPSNTLMSAHFYAISPGYVNTAGTHLLAGRDLTWADDSGKPRVALVNEVFAQTMFGSAPAVGRHFWESDRTSIEIVGVVESGKHVSLTEDPTPAMFFPVMQSADANTTLVVRSQLPTAEVAGALSRTLSGIDAGLPIAISTWPEALSLVLFPARVATAALGIMGLLAAMLAVTGVFGMSAYSVSKRLRELGIRVALGARRTQVIHSALARPMILLISGSLAGVALGVLASRMLAVLVYQATPRDPLVLAGATLTMIAVGLIATWLPARRALAVNPAQLLRDE